ncbi:MAG: ectoine/hydroxyectoine ABC transporter substrate-binding protein EhuB [Castellaniella sp.]|nr:ectoine/hydroxyectoine ABC transporter substrate-binding protein EhuB [Castellaniella sp.]
MNTSLKSCLLATAAASTLGLAPTAQSADLAAIQKSGTIRIAIANEIPYGYMDLNGQAKGVGPDVAKHIAKALGIPKIQWTTTSFGSLIPGLQADRYDMVAAEMAILPQRCQQVAFSEPDSSYGEGLLVAKGNPENLHDYGNFAKSGHKIAIMAGADQLEMLQALKVPADRIVTIANNADAIATVSTGRAAGYAATSLTVSQLATKGKGKVEAARDFKDPVINGQPVRSWGGFTFSRDSAKLREAVNQELAKFKKTDTWKQIMTQYGFSSEDASQSFQRTTAQLCKG